MKNATPERPLNRQQLLIDCRSICEQVYSAWDGEVDVVVLLAPKGKTPVEVAAGRTTQTIEHYRAILQAAAKDAPDGGSIKNMGKVRLT